MAVDDDALICPSASSAWEDAQLLGVVEGTGDAPRVTYTPGVSAQADVLSLVPPELAPEEVFRFSAKCRNEGCPQFVGGACGVAKAAVAHIEETGEDALPTCGIRRHCRWWAQEGPSACKRCSAVVTADKARVGTDFAKALPYHP